MVAVLGDVREAEIASDQAVYQDGGAHGDEEPHGIDRAFAANDKKRFAFQPADNGCQ